MCALCNHYCLKLWKDASRCNECESLSHLSSFCSSFILSVMPNPISSFGIRKNNSALVKQIFSCILFKLLDRFVCCFSFF